MIDINTQKHELQTSNKHLVNENLIKFCCFFFIHYYYYFIKRNSLFIHSFMMMMKKHIRCDMYIMCSKSFPSITVNTIMNGIVCVCVCVSVFINRTNVKV